jgi:hypothetical protein
LVVAEATFLYKTVSRIKQVFAASDPSLKNQSQKSHGQSFAFFLTEVELERLRDGAKEKPNQDSLPEGCLTVFRCRRRFCSLIIFLFLSFSAFQSFGF